MIYARELPLIRFKILSNPMKEPGLNRKAIAYVLSKMEWYWNLADVALGQKQSSSPLTPPDTLRNNLEGHIVDFFKKLLLFQMRSACLYYRNWASIILRDIVKLDDWNGKLTELKDAEAAIRRDIQQYNSEDVKVKLAGIEDNSTLQAESLENIYTAIRDEARRREIKEQNEEDKKCLRALHVTDPQLDKQRIQNQKHGLQTELCDWVFTSTAYERFMTDNSIRILWINGLPGKGKTMLACGVIDRLKKSLRPLAFFFFEGSAAKDNLSGTIRGLVYMLLDYQPSLMSIVRPHYERMGEKLFDSHNSSIMLVEILTEMLKDSCLHEAIVVIDALDECSGRSELIDVINSLSQSCPTKWILTSRPWPEIKTELSTAQGMILLSLEDEKESVSKAVKSYIVTTVDNLARKWGDDPDLKEAISEYMYSHADNTFLWVALVCQRLASSRIPKRRVLEVLKSFPTTLNDLYDAMMSRIQGSEEKDRLIRILATVCIAYRRLAPAELATLVGDMKEDDVADAVDWCGSFLNCQNNEIFLIHQSARDFLVNNIPDTIFPEGIEFRHHSMFLNSLEALSATLQRDIYGLGHSRLTDAQLPTPDPDPLALIGYSCVYWVDHLKSSKSQCETSENELDDGDLVHQFFRSKYLNWIEALSLLRKVPEGILAVQNLEALAVSTQPSPFDRCLTTLWTQTKATGLAEMLIDARRFILYHKLAIEIDPLQVYASALVFSPTRSLVRQLYESESSIRIISPNAAGLDWSSCLQTMVFDAHGMQPRLGSVCFSTDGQWVASGYFGIKVWSTSTSACLKTLQGHQDYVNALAFSPNNLFLASGSSDNTVRLWHPLKGTCTGVLYGHDSHVVSLSFSPNSSTVASGSNDGSIKLWNVTTGACLTTLSYNASGGFISVAFLHGTDTLASVTDRARIDVWDLSTWKLKSTDGFDVTGFAHVEKATFSANTSQVLLKSSRVLKIWDLFAGERAHIAYDGHSFYSVALSPDGTRIALGTDSKIHVLDSHTHQLLQILEGHTDGVSSLAFALKGMQLASGSYDGTVKIWDLDAGTKLPTQRTQNISTPVRFIELSSDGMCLSADPCISVLQVWDRNTGSCLRAFRNNLAQHRSKISRLPLSSDGKKLGLVSNDGCFGIWNVSTGTQMQDFKEEQCGITCATFSSDDAFLASGSNNGTVSIWDPDTGACLKTFGDIHNGTVNSLAISPDNMQVATLCDGNTVGIWDVASGVCRCIIKEFGPDNSIRSMAWSCDSKRLALGFHSGLIRIFHGADGSKQQTLKHMEYVVRALAFSPDDKLLASATFRQVKVWDIGREYCLCTIKGWTTQLAWDPNNKSRLQTDFGDFTIPPYPTEQGNQQPEIDAIPIGLGISSDQAWILRQRIPILWLPPEYRPEANAVEGNDVFISCESREFYCLKFPSL